MSMALGTPLYFLLTEVILLNLLLVASVRHHNAGGGKLARMIG